MAAGMQKIPFRLKSEVPHCQSLWIGVLQGTWNEMGIQYGQRAGRDIARNFDISWRNRVLEDDKVMWQQGRKLTERAEYCAAYIQRSLHEHQKAA